MSTSFQRDYRDLGEQAPNYADVDAVLDGARTRRRRRAGGAALVLLVALGGAGTVVATAGSDRDTGPSIAAPGEIPGRLVPPAAATRLPAAGAVGAGGLVYAACASGCAPLLVLADGRQYALPKAPDGPSTGGYTLSPDGRWLGLPGDGGLTLRELTGGVRYRFTPAIPGNRVTAWAWAPDGSRLLIGEHRDGTVSRYLLVDMATGQATQPTVPAGVDVTGVLPSGELVAATPVGGGAPATRLTLTMLGSGTPVTVAPAGRLRAGEVLALPGNQPQVRVGTDGLVQVTVVRAGATPDDRGVHATAVLFVGLDGTVLGRTDLPARGTAESWQVLGAVPGEVLSAHRTPPGELAVTGTRQDGRSRTLTVLPSGASVTVPGAARH